MEKTILAFQGLRAKLALRSHHAEEASIRTAYASGNIKSWLSVDLSRKELGTESAHVRVKYNRNATFLLEFMQLRLPKLINI
ncbi:unnamed protein product [Caenorhabditis brenneri]